MRHNKKGSHLGRTNTHKDAMLANMACSLIKHKRIFTTVPKAKELRKFVEPFITKSKEDTTHSRRTVFKNLQDKHTVTELFQEVSQKIGDRAGGYTRIIKTGHRLGDNAAMCFIELVDYNENMLKEKATAKAKTRRSRTKKADAAPAPEVAAPKAPKAKTPKVEAPAVETEVKVEKPQVEVANVEEPQVVEEVKVEETPQAEVEATEEEKAAE
ncbi:MAG: 50S ribosomal protein L17 [Dysgonamonadaceae bacterium]|jgi:large subunit ribosomal protein L17|nr:50S ribosomal protein L17 [Dysgonamonadaceae bacterium]